MNFYYLDSRGKNLVDGKLLRQQRGMTVYREEINNRTRKQTIDLTGHQCDSHSLWCTLCGRKSTLLLFKKNLND